MAIATTVDWEVCTDGDDTNGGGFNASRAGATKTAGDNYTYGASKTVIAFTDLSIYSTTANNIHSAGRDFVAADLGHILHINSGTGWNVGFYEITTVTGSGATNRAVVTGATNITTSVSPAGAGSGKMGGALASVGMAGGGMIGYNKLWVKNGTYSIASATPNISTGTLALKAGSYTRLSAVEGYADTRGDRGTPPVLELAGGVTSATIVYLQNVYNTAVNLTVDAKGEAGSTGVYAASFPALVERIWAKNCTSYGIRITGGTGTTALLCRASGCSGTAAILAGAGSHSIGCETYDNTCSGFVMVSTARATDCLSYRNRGSASVHGFVVLGYLHRCTAYYNEGSGVSIGSGTEVSVAQNCVAISNGVEGFGTSAVMNSAMLLNCAGFDNGSGDYNNTNLLAQHVQGFRVLTVNPFVSVATAGGGAANFALNNASGGGKACRAAGYPGSYPSGTTSCYGDIGAAQHLDQGIQTIIVPQRFFQ